MKRFLTPQEKKLLRYEKDRRNTHAESRASSRKSIASRKAQANRSFRHAQNSATAKAAGDLEQPDPVTRKTGKSSWRKIPDAPLAEYVGRTLNRRALNGMNSSHRASALLRQARRKLLPRPTQFKGPLQDDAD